MKSISTVILVACLLVGCNTTNSLMRLSPDYSELPAADLAALATEIETIVSQGDQEFTLKGAGAIVVDTPEMRQAIRTRAIRQPLLTELLDSGYAAEESNGLIAIKRNSAYKKATTSRQRDRDALVVMSENGNRWTLYEGLVEANGWAPRSLSAVQDTFFRARVPLMKSGQVHAPVE